MTVEDSVQTVEIYSCTLARTQDDRCLVNVTIRSVDDGHRYIDVYEAEFGSMLVTTNSVEGMFWAWVNGGHMGCQEEAQAYPGLWVLKA